MRRRFSGRIEPKVRILCRRSESLITITRMSLVMAKISLRKLSA